MARTVTVVPLDEMLMMFMSMIRVARNRLSADEHEYVFVASSNFVDDEVEQQRLLGHLVTEGEEAEWREAALFAEACRLGADED